MLQSLKTISAAALGLSLLFTSPSANAEADKYGFDTAHTQILFFVDHLGFAKSQGEFHAIDGHFTFDEENPQNSMIDISIPTASIDMDDEKWDAHMKNEDFFNVEKYPAMTFKSTEIKLTGDNTAHITGDFTLLDVTKPVTLDVTFNKAGAHPFSGKYVAGFSATTTIKRSEFGMTYGLPAVGDDIEVRLEIEGIRNQDYEAN